MDQDEIAAAYRAHAEARLRGDRAEARRLSDELGFETRMTHLIFTFCLFAQIVLDHFGDDLDREQLAAFTKRLWKKHRADARFEPLKAEALIRAVYGEDYLLDFLTGQEQDFYARILLFRQVDNTPELKDGLDKAITEVQKIIAVWLLDP
ncbi:hypothetical protein [Glycomyces arizonensis]|uniref:hypothetical protein n=1 Tax=Glycomyces arizonensis TaxID=256035 RepID=UPI00042148BA|nr:hypothetical protein [Glycomyces arizonensis]